MADVPRRLRRVFAEIPSINCKGLCWGTCGPITVTALEDRTIREYCEDNNIQHKQLPRSKEDVRARMIEGCMECPHLNKNKQCDIYQVRPAICRMFGVVEGMACPFGCEPEGVLTDKHSQKLLRRLGP